MLPLTFSAPAIDQLITLSSQIGIPVFHSRDIKDPAALCKESLNKALVDARDVLIMIQPEGSILMTA